MLSEKQISKYNIQRPTTCTASGASVAAHLLLEPSTMPWMVPVSISINIQYQYPVTISSIYQYHVTKYILHLWVTLSASDIDSNQQIQIFITLISR